MAVVLASDGGAAAGTGRGGVWCPQHGAWRRLFGDAVGALFRRCVWSAERIPAVAGSVGLMTQPGVGRGAVWGKACFCMCSLLFGDVRVPVKVLFRGGVVPGCLFGTAIIGVGA